jgi:hypothetical protein
LVGIVAGVLGEDFSVSELIDWPAPEELARLKLGAPLPVHAGAVTAPPPFPSAPPPPAAIV